MYGDLILDCKVQYYNVLDTATEMKISQKRWFPELVQ